MARLRHGRSETPEPVHVLPAVPLERRKVLRCQDDEAADQQCDRREDDAADTCSDRGSASWSQQARHGQHVGDLAPRQDGNALFLASNRPYCREHLPGDKSFSFLPKSKIVGKVGYSVIPGKNGEHAGGYLKDRLSRLEKPGARVPVQSVGYEPLYLSPARDAAVRAARSVSHLPLQVARLPEALAGGEGLPHRAQQRRRTTVFWI